MKKPLAVLGAAFLVVIALVVVLLVWAGSAGQEKQEQFFRAVMSGDAGKVTAMFHPALREQVDEPLLAVWMRAARENLGDFQGLSKTDFSTSVDYADGAKRTASSGKVRFEKGEARSDLVFRDDQLVEFNIESEKIPGDWFKSGPAGTDLYRQRGQGFLEVLFAGRAKDAFDMMHAELQAQVPLDQVESMTVKLADAFGKLKSLAHERDELDGPAGKLRIHYRLECEKAQASANVLFTFVGLKGHLTGFNVNEPEAPGTAAGEADGQTALKALDDARKAGILSEQEYQRKKAELEAALKPAQAEPAIPEPLREKLTALDDARKSGVLSEQEYQQKKAELEAAFRPAPAEPAEPAIPEPVRQKLAALDEARKSGVLSDQEYEQKKADLLGQPRPAAGGSPAAAPTAAAPAAKLTAAAPAALPAAGRKGNLYQHALGFKFWYPDGWAVKEAEGGLQLQPPDPGTQDGSPTELYFMVGESIEDEGIRNASDPAIVAYLDTVIANLSPALKRTAEPAPIDAGTDKGVVLDWSGQSATSGQVRARAFVTIIKDYGVTLIAIGVDERLKKRDADLRSMFTSLGFGPGKLDGQLVGAWHLLSTYAISNESPFETSASRARMVSDTNSVITMAADGTWTRTDTTQTIAMGAGVSLEGSDRKVRRGKWNADGGSLYLVSEENAWEEYKYQVSGTPGARQVKLVSGGNGEVWQETR